MHKPGNEIMHLFKPVTKKLFDFKMKVFTHMLMSREADKSSGNYALWWCVLIEQCCPLRGGDEAIQCSAGIGILIFGMFLLCDNDKHRCRVQQGSEIK